MLGIDVHPEVFMLAAQALIDLHGRKTVSVM